MLKYREIADPNSCLSRAADDEPVFTLRAHDGSAPELVREWARIRMEQIAEGRKPLDDIAQCREAYELAAQMEWWREAEIRREESAAVHVYPTPKKDGE